MISRIVGYRNLVWCLLAFSPIIIVKNFIVIELVQEFWINIYILIIENEDLVILWNDYSDDGILEVKEEILLS